MSQFSWDEIVIEMRTRFQSTSTLHQRMIDVRNRYNGSQVGDYILPYSNPEESEALDPMTPVLVAEAIDSLAMRAGETLPGIICPSIEPGKEVGVRSTQYADKRRRSILECYERSRFVLGMRRAYRHLFGYASMAMAIMPDSQIKAPRIRVLDPLTAFPDPQTPEDLSDPKNVGFIFGKSAEYIRQTWEMARTERGGPVPPQQSETQQLWDVCLWCDQEEWVMGLMGVRETRWGQSTWVEGFEPAVMELSRRPHRLSRVPFILPKRVTLDAIISQVGNVLGHVDLQAKIMRLEIAAAERAIFPDKYVTGPSSTGVTVNDGTNKWKDGRSGEVNVLLDATNVGNLPATPDPISERLQDRLERNFRVSTGLVPQTGGETYGALRTGRGIDALMGAAVDPRVQEAQEIAQAYVPHLNEAILETYEKHYSGRTFFLFTNMAGDYDRVEFKPSDHVEGCYDNKVRYSITGAGVEATNIVLTQMVGAKLMSRRSAMERHPYVFDAVREATRINEEALEEAMLQGLLQQLVAGTLPPIMAAFMEEELTKEPGIDIFEALRRADGRVRQLQSERPPEGTPALEPGIAAGAPAGPSAPAEMQPQIGPPGEIAQLRELNNALAASNRQVGAA